MQRWSTEKESGRLQDEGKEQDSGYTLSKKWRRGGRCPSQVALGLWRVTDRTVWRMKISKVHLVHEQGYLVSYVNWWGCVSRGEAIGRKRSHLRLISLKKDQSQQATLTSEPSPEWIDKGMVSHLEDTQSVSYQSEIWENCPVISGDGGGQMTPCYCQSISTSRIPEGSQDGVLEAYTGICCPRGDFMFFFPPLNPPSANHMCIRSGIVCPWGLDWRWSEAPNLTCQHVPKLLMAMSKFSSWHRLLVAHQVRGLGCSMLNQFLLLLRTEVSSV